MMCERVDLVEVACETQDDITLFWSVLGGLEEVEFVQVKSERLGQLWSVALLTAKESASSDKDGDNSAGDGIAKKKKSKKTDASSILEKSLQKDCGCEKARFRVVTCRPVMQELKVLTHQLDSPYRDTSTNDYSHLVAQLNQKLGDARSLNGNGCDYWARNTQWDVIHDNEPIENKNIIKVIELAQAYGQILVVDQARALYERILTRVRDASLAEWDTEREKKVFRQADFVTWFTQSAYDAAHPGRNGAGKTLEDKLKDAHVTDDVIETARSLRLKYLGTILTPRYSDPEKRAEVETEIETRLMRLRTRIDSGELSVDGPIFHSLCQSAVDDVYAALPEKHRPPLPNLYGYMYNLADRCTHRFVRATS